MNKDVEMVDTQKLKSDKSEDQKNTTYSFKGEDHTLGNLVRSMIIKDSDTEFCGYSVPHPSEEIMNIRVQTYYKSLERIHKVCDIMLNKYEQALNKFKRTNK